MNKKQLKKRESINGCAILAFGEKTGHHHSFESNLVELYEDEARPADSWLVVKNEVADLKHQEHSIITHPKGEYFCGRKVEGSDENEPLTVAD